MIKRFATCVAVITLWAGSARSEQRLGSELSEQIEKGTGRLTEDDVLKLVPGQVTVEFDVGGIDADYVLIWEEIRRIRVEFLDGKVSSVTGTLSDVVASKSLTLDNLKKIAKGMRRKDVESLLAADSGSFRMTASKDSQGRDVQVCKWEQGRVLRVSIKGGKVNGRAYLNSVK